jgi:uncharacterized protein with HEPN domain
MYDKDLVIEILIQILNSTDIILLRFEPINEVHDFTSSSYGMEKLDSICMQLIAIGESLKKIDKMTNGKLLENYPDVNWKGAKAMRDIIGHHYFDIDAEIIFDVCKNKIHDLRNAIQKMIADTKVI